MAEEIDRVRELQELPKGVAKELEYVLDLAPRFFWLVGPGTIEPAAHVYSVEVAELNTRFTRVDDVPPFGR